MPNRNDGMQPDDNPTTAGAPAHNPFGQAIGRPLRPFRGGENHTDVMSAPTSRDKHCIFLDKAMRANFVIRTPAGITAFTVRYGRWVTGKSYGGSGTGLDGWLELGSVAFTSLSDGQLVELPPFETHMDAVGIYVSAKTGTASQNFRFWCRGLPGA